MCVDISIPTLKFPCCFNITAQINEKLTPSSFPQWRARFEALLIGYDLMDYVLGESPRNTWVRQDKLILSAILASTSQPLPLLLPQKTSYDARKNYPPRMQVNRIALIDHPISDDDITLYVLNGLGPKFVRLLPYSGKRKSLAFEEFHDLLIGHENYLQDGGATQQLVAPNFTSRRSAFRISTMKTSHKGNGSPRSQGQYRFSNSNGPSRDPRRSNNQGRFNSNQRRYQPKCRSCDQMGHMAKAASIKFFEMILIVQELDGQENKWLINSQPLTISRRYKNLSIHSSMMAPMKSFLVMARSTGDTTKRAHSFQKPSTGHLPKPTYFPLLLTFSFSRTRALISLPPPSIPAPPSCPDRSSQPPPSSEPIAAIPHHLRYIPLYLSFFSFVEHCNHEWVAFETNGRKQCFLHGNLTETVYMMQPPGFKDLSRPDYVCRLRKAIYGLKQAPRACHYNDKKFVAHVVTKLGDQFSLKDMGSLHYFLGVEVIPTTAGVFLSQHKYVRDILENTHMAGAKDVSTHGTNVVNKDEYRRVIGVLQYLSLTRPDISFLETLMIEHPHQLTLHLLQSHLMEFKNNELLLVPPRNIDRQWCIETMWLLAFFKNWVFIKAPPSLLYDNLGATHLSFNPVQHSRMKHIQIDLHFVLSYGHTQDQLADLLTKAKIGLADGSSILWGDIGK
ncbi:hypothetical protein AAG906_032021 [Vitis piasezkii]